MAGSRKQYRSAPPVQVDVFTDMASVRGLWRAFQRDAAGGPHDTWEWNEAWLRTAGKRDKPLIATGRLPSGATLFLLPLAMRRRKGCNVLEWLGSDQGNYSSGLFRPSAWEGDELPRGTRLMKLVLAALPRVDAVHLADQPEEIGESTNPLATCSGVRSASAGHVFPLSNDWQTHFNARFTPKQRSRLRNLERQLKSHGSVVFEDVTDPARRLQVLDHMIGEKRRWFADRGIHDFLADADMRDFFRHLAQMPGDGPGPALRIFTLRVGDEIVSTTMGLVHRNIFYGLIASTTAGPLRRHGPGRLSYLRIVEYLANEGIEMIDCGAGEDEEKLRWCTDTRERRHAIAAASTKGHVYAAALTLVLHTKRHIKQSPALWNWTQRLRQWKSLAGMQPRSAQAAASPSRVHGMQA